MTTRASTLGSPTAITLRVVWNGAVLEPAHEVAATHRFQDVSIAVPASAARGENRLEVTLVRGLDYPSFHYFYVQS